MHAHSIAHESALRTKWIKKVAGGVSQLTRDILRDCFLGPNSLATAGMQVPLDGDAVIVKVSLQSILGDEEALNSMFYIKGASGILPCGVGCSVVNKQTAHDRELGVESMAARDSEIQDIGCSNLSLCGVRSDEDIWNFCEELRAEPKDTLNELEHSTGLKLHEDTLLFDVPLRPFVEPATVITFDPMHILFSNGLLNAEVMLFLGWLKDFVGGSFENVREFGKDWTPLTRIFSAQRESSSGEFLKCGASELIAGYPLLRRFVQEIFGDNAKEPPAVVSFLKLCEICDQVALLLKGLSKPEVELIVRHLRVLVREYLDAFKIAHGEAKVRFKHHQLLHLVEHILKHLRMLNCWVLERKHIAMKQCMVHNRTVLNISKTGLSRMLNAQLRMLEDPGWHSALDVPSQAFPELAASLSAKDVRISRAMRWRGISLSNSALVFLDTAKTYLIYIVACLSIDNEWGLMVRLGQRVSGTKVASIWQVAAEVKLYNLVDERVFPAAFHRWLSTDRVELLH